MLCGVLLALAPLLRTHISSHTLRPVSPPPLLHCPACPPAAALMSSVYEDHKDEDGFLYITYSGENTFGSSGDSSSSNACSGDSSSSPAAALALC